VEPEAEAPEAGSTPYIWRPCCSCEKYWCELHQEHVHECECPPVEKWPQDVQPYLPDQYQGNQSRQQLYRLLNMQRDVLSFVLAYSANRGTVEPSNWVAVFAEHLADLVSPEENSGQPGP